MEVANDAKKRGLSWRARASGSASVGLVGGKGFSCHLRQTAGIGNGGWEQPKKKKNTLYLGHVVRIGRRVPGSKAGENFFMRRN